MHRSANGISYIHNGSGGQFIIETYIIFVICKLKNELNVFMKFMKTDCAIAAGFICIIHAVKQNGGKIDPKKKKSLY
ncbi:hypothetical protein BLA29_006768 [Euroglyphus maynei]|uniref:Uncharacterized protein n=1 Tax=Euroglyphus maynei TaxID=6958 RepID=A0A1Y3BGL1_EURMA|nr:hypothetical protein BLA29_006768 [Euroglyphus maynei]